MRQVMIMSGVSGSGKSTYARNILSNSSSVVSADNFFMVEGKYQFVASKLGLAHSKCFRDFLDVLQCNMDDHLLIVDNTNTTTEEISPYVLGAQSFGWEVEVITIETPRPDLLRKCAERNSHGVSVNVILSQAARIANRRMPRYWPSRTVTMSEV